MSIRMWFDLLTGSRVRLGELAVLGLSIVLDWAGYHRVLSGLVIDDNNRRPFAGLGLGVVHWLIALFVLE